MEGVCHKHYVYVDRLFFAVISIGLLLQILYWKYIYGLYGCNNHDGYLRWSANLTVPFLAKRLGKRNLYSGAAMIQLAGLVVIFLGKYNTGIILAGAVISACGYGVKESIYFSMQADPVDYGEWKTGIQATGMLSSLNGFLGKVAQAAAGGISGLLLAWGAYDSTAVVQTTEALIAIKAMYLYIPMILLVCSIVTMHFYKLDQQFPQIQKDLETRRKEVK